MFKIYILNNKGFYIKAFIIKNTICINIIKKMSELTNAMTVIKNGQYTNFSEQMLSSLIT